MLKGAIIGVGKIALECHLPAFQNNLISDRAMITAAADTNQASLDNAKLLYPGIKYYSKVNDLLESEKFDFIDICTPPVYHYMLLKEGILRNLNIICEKPFALELKDAKQIYEMLMNSSLFFMPCHQYRYSPVWEQFKTFVNEMDPLDSSYLQFNIFRTEADQGLKVLNNIWRINPEISGGGILSDTGVHYLYLCLWMLGLPISVTARTFNLQHKKYNIEDTATIILEFKKSIAEINLTWAADRRANSARLVTRRGSLVYDGKMLIKNENNSSKELTVPDASDKSSYAALYVSLFNNFISAVEEHSSDKSMLSEALQTVKLLDLCYRSACDKNTLEFNAE